MNVRHPIGVVHSFSIKKILYDKMGLRLFYFRVTKSLHKNYPYSELFWSAFSRIWTEYAVRMRENADQNNSDYGIFLRSENASEFFRILPKIYGGYVLKNSSKMFDWFLNVLLINILCILTIMGEG